MCELDFVQKQENNDENDATYMNCHIWEIQCRS